MLVISSEPVGEAMLGSAIRAFELARALGAKLVAPETDFPRHDARALRPYLAEADVVITQPPWPHVMAELRRSGARLVFDLYDPEPLEELERREGLARRAAATLTLDRFRAALAAGDLLLCASETQRSLYIGMLVALRLLPPDVYDADPTLRSRLMVVPFGVPDEPAPAGTPDDEEVVLWNGGIWPWLDAPTAIGAVRELAQRRPGVKLVFMGGGHALEEARAAATGAPVEFNDGWVPYEERGAWLARARVAISTHRDHLETRFAFRTRLLDCFWARLPVVATEGDALAERIARDGLGEAVPAGDVPATAAALERILVNGRDAYRPALARAAEDFRWSRAVAPLAEWLQAPPPHRAQRRAPNPRDAGFRAALRLLGRWPRLG